MFIAAFFHNYPKLETAQILITGEEMNYGVLIKGNKRKKKLLIDAMTGGRSKALCSGKRAQKLHGLFITL